ncbi:MAG TPA: HYR domain-containing protein [Thermoanaerobaculia bacterium]|nr:HYR domain-containing protein [Thermoanaerobaculia bacterium]
MSRRHAVAFLFLILTVPAFAGITVPADMTAEATGPGGAVVTYRTGTVGAAEDENGRTNVAATCAPSSGSLFPLGTTRVSCTGSDGSSASFSIIVNDTTAPSLAIPRGFNVVSTSSAGAVVNYPASANDLVDGSVAVSCAPASGTRFPAGTTVVQCSASDARLNRASGSFSITVIVPTPAPPPADMTVEATGPNGATVLYKPIDGGEDENGRSAVCSPASGSVFPLGATTVRCGVVSFKVTVVDTTAPVLYLPGDLTATATSAAGATVTFTATARDIVDGTLPVGCSPPSGSTFAIGTTQVVCTANDTHGNSAMTTFAVTVMSNDTEAPVITSIVAAPDVLTPPNHDFETVTLTVTVHDDDPSPLVRIFDVTSNESIAATDWEITGLLTVKLRRERDPQGTGRIYTIHVEAIDAAGNRGTGTVNVTVPHDSSNSANAPAAPPPTKRRSARG